MESIGKIKIKKRVEKGFWACKVNQKNFLESLGKKLGFRSLEDWKTIKWTQFRQNGGNSLLNHYNSNLALLLKSIYPEYDWNLMNDHSPKTTWKIKSNKITKITKINSLNVNWDDINVKRNFLDNLFVKLKLKKFEEWNNLEKLKIIENGGKDLLKKYNGNIKNLISSTYPEKSILLYEKKKPNKYWHSIDNQKKFMDNLLIKLHLKSIITWKDIKENGGGSLLTLYNFNVKKMIDQIYQTKEKQNLNNNNNNNNNNEIRARGYWKIRENIVNEVEKIYFQLKLKSVEDLRKITRKILGNFDIVSALRHFNHRFENILFFIYPNFPWHSIDIDNNNKNENIQEEDNNNNNNDNDNENIVVDWKWIDSMSTLGVQKNIESEVVSSIRSSDYLLELNCDKKIDINKCKRKKSKLKKMNQFKYEEKLKKIDWNNLDNQRKFLDYLFKKLNFNSFNDWNTLKKLQIKENGGKGLLKKYNGNIKTLISFNYPEQSFLLYEKKKPNKYWYSFDNQKAFMDQLFIKLNLKSIDDWNSVTWKEIAENGGSGLISKFGFSVSKLVSSIYPSFRVNFNERSKPHFFWESLENQRKYLNYLFEKLKFNSMDDWKEINCDFLIANGAVGLVKEYKRDLNQMFTKIFPEYQWNFQSQGFTLSKLLFFQRKFMIEKKDDWYRLSPSSFSNLFSHLKRVHTDQSWNFSIFRKRLKKSKQRWLFICVKRIYPHFEVIEGYRSPQLMTLLNYPYEIDIFIANVNIGVEYHGEQHFDDFPSAFSPVEQYKLNEDHKTIICKENFVNLRTVPYWWDQTIPSLLSLLRI